MLHRHLSTVHAKVAKETEQDYEPKFKKPILPTIQYRLHNNRKHVVAGVLFVVLFFLFLILRFKSTTSESPTIDEMQPATNVQAATTTTQEPTPKVEKDSETNDSMSLFDIMFQKS
jgi:Ca2+/Na+ antiporter